MIQAFIIKKKFPHLRYRVTDYDPYIIDKCLKLSILSDLEKDVLDISRLNTMEFETFPDLLISFAVEYAIDDDSLFKMFALLKENSASYLMCAPGMIGPLQYLNILKNKSAYKKLLQENKLRMHGWLRSIGHLKQLANKANLQLDIIGSFGPYMSLLFKP